MEDAGVPVAGDISERSVDAAPTLGMRDNRDEAEFVEWLGARAAEAAGFNEPLQAGILGREESETLRTIPLETPLVFGAAVADRAVAFWSFDTGGAGN